MYLIKVLIKNKDYEYKSDKKVVYEVIEDVRNKILKAFNIKHDYHIYDIKKLKK